MEPKPAPPAAVVPEVVPALGPPAAPAAPAPPPINTADAMQAIVNDPAVKKAMEVFNARIIHVEPRRN